MLERLTRIQLLLLGAFCGIAGAGLVAAAIVGMVIAFGWYDVAATKRHWPITTWILHTTMIDSVWLRSGGNAPTLFSAAQVRDGFKEYDEHCAMCHGAPGVARAKWVMGLDPPPPYLIDVSRRFSPSELKFIISHGIKMTGMPGWELSEPAPTILDLVAFLEKMPDITPAQYQRMRIEARNSKSAQEAAQ